NPALPDHDRNGFRNADVPRSAEIVVLGDSQTYGVNATRDEAWPQQLQQITGRTTYNLAYGGYGPAHYLALLPEAQKLSPRVIIVAMYAGNDLFDCYNLVHGHGQMPELLPDDAAVLTAIAAAEASDPLMPHIDALFAATAGVAITQTNPEPAAAPAPHPFALRQCVSDYSKLYGLLRATKDAMRPRAAVASPTTDEWATLSQRAAEHPDALVMFEHAGVRTVFTPAYRGCALDLADPRIADGERIALESLRKLCEQIRAAGVEPVLLLIPTKERVFANAITDADTDMPAEYEHLIANEELLWSATKAAAANLGVTCIDALPALQAALAADQSPYPPNADGHPNADGYHIIAQTVAGALQDR
ncbi:MAG: SGNH/GDSL hydrolase family protein, partial [Phycisphaerae bacterium]|nr:SGNH/GDSL hydrolase family protein [Phycisphaerae bacterium]